MKKRTLSIFTALSMILSMFTFGAAAKESDDYSKAEQLCIGLGCISQDEYDSEAVVTRAEFAKIIANLCGMDTDTRQEKWNESAYGEEDISAGAADNYISYFDDVDKSHPNYNEIIAVYNAGYMRGISRNRFAPEYDITVFEAAKVIADMLGYAKPAELWGGYPNGYKTVFSQVGLLNGVKSAENNAATQADILKIIYNALDVKIMEFKISAETSLEESDKTFMEGVLKTYKTRGTVTDNGITATDSKSAIGKDEIKVADIVAVLPESMSAYRKYIGRTVDMYYTYDKEADEYTVRYIALKSDDDAVTFNIDDFISFDGSQVTYSMGKRTLKEKIDENANLIYNNKYKGIYDKSIFDFEAGDVTLCSSTGDKADLIIINDYDFVYVTGTNENDKLIYNGLKNKTDASMNILELDEENFPEYIVITDENGKDMEFSDIAEGDVLNVLKCDGGIEITVSRNAVENFVVTAKNTNDLERTVIGNNETEYEILKTYSESADAKNIIFNKAYTLHLNMFGTVIWISGGENDGYQIGILTKAVYDEDESLAILKMYTMNGTITNFNAEEKISLNGKKGKFEILTAQLENLLGQAVLYSVSSEGKINGVISAAEFMDGDALDRGWHRINPDGSYSYGANGNDLGGFFYYVKNKTKVITVPENAADYGDETNFSIGIASFGDNKSYNAEAFSTSPYAIEADVIVLRQSASSGGAIEPQSAFVIESITSGLGADDQEITELSGYLMKSGDSTAKSMVLQLDPDAVMVGMGNPATEIDKSEPIEKVGPRTPSELEKGDVIRYNTNSKGYVDTIRIAYDYDLQKTYHGSSGSEAGSFAQASSYAGWVISKEGSGVRFSSGIRPENLDYTNSSQIISNIKAMRLNSTAIVVVEKSGKKLTVRPGTVNDIVAYNDSRAVGSYSKLAVFTYYTASAYGAVVYK